MTTPSEAQFQAAVIDYALLTGWLVFHVSDSRKEVIERRKGGAKVSRMVGDALTRGWPDLTLVHPRRGLLVIRELKSARGRVTKEQDKWLRALHGAGVDVDVWRPADWPEIEAVLGGKRQRKERAA